MGEWREWGFVSCVSGKMSRFRWFKGSGEERERKTLDSKELELEKKPERKQKEKKM